jgi:hypothetical protein
VFSDSLGSSQSDEQSFPLRGVEGGGMGVTFPMYLRTGNVCFINQVGHTITGWKWVPVKGANKPLLGCRVLELF